MVVMACCLTAAAFLAFAAASSALADGPASEPFWPFSDGITTVSALVRTSGREAGSGPKNRTALLAGLVGRRAVGVRGRGAAIRSRGLARIPAATRPGDVDHGVVEDKFGAGDVSRAMTRRLLRTGLPGEGSLDSRR
jgi:hypothetical protein